MLEEEFKLHQNIKLWNIAASIFFIILCLFMYSIFLENYTQDFSLNFFDILVLVFANYRLIRLFIYDNMTLFIREFFLDLDVKEEVYKYVDSKNSFKNTMYKLMTCPWCFGVWSAFVSTFIYFTYPTFKFVFIILAISSVASFFIILTNLIGWHAEGKKKEVQSQ